MKTGIDDKVSERILDILDKKDIKQSQLLKRCSAVNMPISQPDMSRIYNGKRLSLYQIAALSKALKVSIDSLVWGKEKEKEDFLDTHDSETLLSCPGDASKEFNCYEGRFYTFFLSTSENEDHVIRGMLDVEKKKEYCELQMSIDTGIRGKNGNIVKKDYIGRILITQSLDTAYLLLKNESIGEICMICLRHRRFNVEQAECRIGLCLTVSAGEVKEPTVHRILLTRQKLLPEHDVSVVPWLKLIGYDLYIEKSKLEVFIKDFAAKTPESQDELLNMVESGNTVREYYKTSVETLRRQVTLNREQFVMFITGIFNIAESAKNVKITSTDDIKLFDLLKVLTTSVSRVDVSS